jgi:hypothetical protein
MRGAVAENRLQREENGDISYLLKAPWSDGTKAVHFTPLEFVDRSAIAIEARSLRPWYPHRGCTRFGIMECSPRTIRGGQRWYRRGEWNRA